MINKSSSEINEKHCHKDQCGCEEGECCVDHCSVSFCGVRPSWTAVIVGALVGVGLAFLLNLFGLAIGLSAFTTSETGLKTLAMGGFVGMILVTIITTFISGFVSGYLGRSNYAKPYFGVLYGFTTWCLALILTIILSAHVGQYVQTQFASISNYKGSVVRIASPSTHPAATSQTAQVNVNDEKEVRTIGNTLLLTFLLFFIGAVSSSYGGYVGLRGKYLREDRK